MIKKKYQEVDSLSSFIFLATSNFFWEYSFEILTYKANNAKEEKESHLLKIFWFVRKMHVICNWIMVQLYMIVLIEIMPYLKKECKLWGELLMRSGLRKLLFLKKGIIHNKNSNKGVAPNSYISFVGSIHDLIQPIVQLFVGKKVLFWKCCIYASCVWH